jgi:hypothetical protein
VIQRAARPSLTRCPRCLLEGSVWRLDVNPPSQCRSRRTNARRCWRGSARPPSGLGVPGGDGLFYSGPIGCRSPRLPTASGSADALSPSGRSVFCRMAWKVWQASLAAAGAEGRLALTLTHIAGMGNFHHRSRVSSSRETSPATPQPRKVHTGALGWQRRGSGGTTVRERQGTHPARSEGSERPDRHLPRLSRRAA